MKTATLLAFLLLGLACTYAVSAEEEITEDEPQVEDEMIKDDEEEIENDEEEEEKRAIIRPRPCRLCRRKIVRRYGIRSYCTLRCWCKGLCRYNRCNHGYRCKIVKCSKYSYPRCPY